MVEIPSRGLMIDHPRWSYSSGSIAFVWQPELAKDGDESRLSQLIRSIEVPLESDDTADLALLGDPTRRSFAVLDLSRRRIAFHAFDSIAAPHTGENVLQASEVCVSGEGLAWGPAPWNLLFSCAGSVYVVDLNSHTARELAPVIMIAEWIPQEGTVLGPSLGGELVVARPDEMTSKSIKIHNAHSIGDVAAIQGHRGAVLTYSRTVASPLGLPATETVLAVVDLATGEICDLGRVSYSLGP